MLGSDEAAKPYAAMAAAGCDLWRNWDDIQCSYESLSSVIAHYGNWSHALAAAAPDHEVLAAARRATPRICATVAPLKLEDAAARAAPWPPARSRSPSVPPTATPPWNHARCSWDYVLPHRMGSLHGNQRRPAPFLAPFLVNQHHGTAARLAQQSMLFTPSARPGAISR